MTLRQEFNEFMVKKNRETHILNLLKQAEETGKDCSGNELSDLEKSVNKDCIKKQQERISDLD